MRTLRAALCSSIGLMVLLIAQPAAAFCGFYVGGAGAELFNDASQVVLMRQGTTTVLSMQNSYEGPLDAFAMVVPVPEVLMQDNVKTLPVEIFDRIDVMGAPRLVEYQEEDPCSPVRDEDDGVLSANGGNNGTNNGGVVVQAQFVVGEYDITILSASEGTALDTWLIDNGYNVPTGAAPYYQPYIDSGQYFFVARVLESKVTYENGRAVLSPLRFHFETTDFSLPIRLGMMNSKGEQDLIVHILAKDRYELANYANVTIPTNIDVLDDVRNDFGGFFRALFARTLQDNPGAIVTEYSWDAASCDPCPGPTLQPDDFVTLGADVMPGFDPNNYWPDLTLTRLHARYAKDEIGEDLVFAQAEPIVGGRERYDANGKIEKGAQPSTINNFQGRYIIRHLWKGEVDCPEPAYERWGQSTATASAQSPNTSRTALEPIGSDADPTQFYAPAPPQRRGVVTDDCSCSTPGGGPIGLVFLMATWVASHCVRKRRTRGA